MNKKLLIILGFLVFLLLVVPVVSAASVNWTIPAMPFRQPINISNSDADTLIEYHTIIVSGFNTSKTNLFNLSEPENFEVVCNQIEVDRLIGNRTDLGRTNTSGIDGTQKLYPDSTGWGSENLTFMFRLPMNITTLESNSTACHIYYGNTSYKSTYNNESNIALLFDQFNKADGNVGNLWSPNTDQIGNGWLGPSKTTRPLDIKSCGDCQKYSVYTQSDNAAASYAGAVLVSNNTQGTVFYGNREVDAFNVRNVTTMSPPAITAQVIKNGTVFDFSTNQNYTFVYTSFDSINRGDYECYIEDQKYEWTTINSTKFMPNGFIENITLFGEGSPTKYNYIMIKRWIETEPTVSFGDEEGILTQIVEDSDTHVAEEENTITLYTIKENTPVINATLYWNNTNYGAGIRTKINSSVYRFVNTFTIPAGSGSSSGEVISYDWVIEEPGKDNINKTGTQTIYETSLDDCSTNTEMILNYTLVDEANRTQTFVNPRIDVTVTITSLTGTGSWNYSGTKSAVTHQVCLSKNVLNNSNFTLTATAEYESDGHVIEFNYVQNYLLTKQPDTQLQHIYLHDLTTADSTSFLVTYLDDFYLPVDGAIIDVWRYYTAEGKWRSVEHGKTNEDGETVLHLVTEDVEYQFFVRVDGSLVFTSGEVHAYCPTAPCSIDLQEEVEDIDHPDFHETTNLDYTLILDEDARQVTFTFQTDDGSSAVFNLSSWQLGGPDNVTICSEQETSNGGTLTCSYPTTLANSTYVVQATMNSVIVEFAMFVLDQDAMENYGLTGLFMAAILVLSLILMGATSGVAVVIFGFIGLVTASLMGILETGPFKGGALMWALVAGAILLWKVATRRSQ